MKDYLLLTESTKRILFYIDRLFTKTGLVIVLLFIVFAPVKFVPDALGVPTTRLVIIGIAAGFLWGLIWSYHNFFLPRPSNWSQRKIRIIIAIDDGGEFEKYALVYDFCRKIKSHLGTRFELVLLPRCFTRQICAYSKRDSDDRDLRRKLIEKLNRKVRGAYWVFGEVEKEIQGGNNTFFINSEAAVFHQPVSAEIHTELAIDFQKLFSEKLSFCESEYSIGIGFASMHAGLTAKYIIGVACLVSGDPFTALKLHKDLHLDFEDSPKPTQVDSSHDDIYKRGLINKLLDIQNHEYRLICNYYYQKKNVSEWERIVHEWTDLANKYQVKHIDLYSNRAIYEFQNNNLKEARRLTKESFSLPGNKIAKYNLVFLDIYEEQYELAKNRMKEILHKKSLSNERGLVLEIIRYIDDILGKEPNRAALIYWQAELYRKIDNIPMAFGKIEHYINLVGRSKTDVELQNPRKFKSEMEKHMRPRKKR